MNDQAEMICKNCGATYTMSIFASHYLGLCPACRDDHQKARRSEYMKEYRKSLKSNSVKKAPVNPPKTKSLEEVECEANAKGMTYGQYMAYQKNQAT